MTISDSLQFIAMLEVAVLHSCLVLHSPHAMLGAGSAVHALHHTDCTDVA